MQVFESCGIGYKGQAMTRAVLQRGHSVRVLARPGSENKVPAGAEVLLGNALDASTFGAQVRRGETFVQLVGVAHPSPAKAQQFRSIDQVSAIESFRAAEVAKVGHFIYVSVAHPAPAMKAYWQARAECEDMLMQTGLNATVLRPWYVLGPGHWWPYVLVPFYKLADLLPSTSETAKRLGLVPLAQMGESLVWAVDNPAGGRRVMDVTAIRQAR